MKMSRVLPESFLSKVAPADRLSLGKAGTTKAEAEKHSTLRNERDLQRLLVNYLRLQGIEPLWFRTDKRTTANVGWPDFTFSVVSNGRAIPCLWEIKFGNGKLSPEQSGLADKLQSHPNGWRYRVITSFAQARSELSRMMDTNTNSNTDTARGIKQPKVD